MGDTALNRWLSGQLRKLQPGDALPPDRIIAALTGVSARTVQRTMSSYRKEGRLVRIRGKGTFVPPGPPGTPVEFGPPAPSARDLADRLAESIARGEMKRGEPVPSQKVLTPQFRVGPQTVTAACRQLVRQGLVTHVGKRYFVGTFHALTRGDTKKRVYLLASDTGEFRRAFRSDFLAHAYRRLHHELSANGFVLLFGTWDDVPGMLDRWRRDRRMPYGLVFFKVANEQIGLIQSTTTGIAERARAIRQPRPPMLIDFHRSAPTRTVAGHVLLRSHMSTSVARSIAAFVGSKGYRQVCFFYDTRGRYNMASGYSWLSVWPILKLRNELRVAGVRTRFKLVAGNAGKTFDIDIFLRRHISHVDEAAAAAILTAYRMRSLWDVAEECICAPSFIGCYAELAEPNSLWVFASDKLAVEALEWARERGVQVPQEVAIMGLESDLDCLPAGITCVEPDLDTLGYLMARTVVGDMPVARTSQGYLRTPAIVRERLTT